MTSEQATLQQLLEAVQSLRGEVGALSQRVAALEAAPVPLPSAPQPGQPESETLTEDLVLTISAAIAAYLGVTPHIRQIRLLGSASWAQQGRATIQASHQLSLHHG